MYALSATEPGTKTTLPTGRRHATASRASMNRYSAYRDGGIAAVDGGSHAPFDEFNETRSHDGDEKDIEHRSSGDE